MARFGFFENSPQPTPGIDESEFNINSVRSTPCPGRGSFPQGPGDDSSLMLDEEDTLTMPNEDNASDIRQRSILVPDSAAAPPAGQTPHHNRAKAEQTDRLRVTLTTLREALTNSTALVNNLRTRNDFFRAENLAKQAQLTEVQKARDSAKVVAQEQDARWRFVVLVVSLLVVVSVGYAYWCWCEGPEMQYVLRRRREVLGI